MIEPLFPAEPAGMEGLMRFFAPREKSGEILLADPTGNPMANTGFGYKTSGGMGGSGGTDTSGMPNSSKLTMPSTVMVCVGKKTVNSAVPNASSEAIPDGSTVALPTIVAFPKASSLGMPETLIASVRTGVPNASKLTIPVGPTVIVIRGVPKASSPSILGGKMLLVTLSEAVPNASADAIPVAVTVCESSSVSGGNGS